MLPNDLVHFTASEFKHPELMESTFCYFLDAVRTRYGAPLVITSDGRTPEENAVASGSSPTSLHLLGRAVDLRWMDDAVARWGFVNAVFDTAKSVGASIELELVNGPADRHMHVGVFPDHRPSRLLVEAT